MMSVVWIGLIIIKYMPYTERNLASEFSKWLRKSPNKHVLQFPFALELKIKRKGHKLNIKNDFQPQQIPSLMQVLEGCLYHKISDMAKGAKPFDSFQMCHSPAFIGVMWYEPRKPKILYLLDPREITTNTIAEAWADTNYIFKINLSKEKIDLA